MDQTESEGTIDIAKGLKKGDNEVFEGTKDREMESEVKQDELDQDNDCDSFHLLHRKTQSFRCLHQTLLSSSSLMRNKDFIFPPLQDPGINETFNYVEPEPVYDDIGVDKYTRMCKDLEIVSISRVIRFLHGDTLNLTYYGLTPKQMKALTETLKMNTHVRNLLLQDNWMNAEVSEMLCNMLQENTSITVLNLKECRIGEEGAEKLNETLSISQVITELNLSFNSLGDKGIMKLQSGLSEAPNLRVLNLSHNNLTEECAPALENILLDNSKIEELDISWNSFFTGPGNKKIFNAMRANDSLHVLNIAWNGISEKAAAVPISKYLKLSQHLEYLDISHNRLEGRSLKPIQAGILKNHSLRCVKIGSNGYPPDQAYSLASILPRKVNDPLVLLDMENVVFEKNFLKLMVNIRRARKNIIYDSILGNFVIHGPDRNKLLFERCRYILQKPKSKKKKKDFGHFILILPDGPMSRTDFDVLLKKKKIKKLDKDLLNELCGRFPLKKNIDCVEMKKSYMGYYPDTVLPPPPSKKGKKGKKGKGKKDKKTVAEEPQTTPAEGTALGAPVEGQIVQQQPSEVQRLEGQAGEEPATEGEVMEGETTEGEVTEGEDTEEEATVGEDTEGEATEGDATEGETTEGEDTEEEGIEGSEAAPDPIVINTEDSAAQNSPQMEENVPNVIEETGN